MRSVEANVHNSLDGSLRNEFSMICLPTGSRFAPPSLALPSALQLTAVLSGTRSSFSAVNTAVATTIRTTTTTTTTIMKMAVSCENMVGVDDPWKGVSNAVDPVEAFEDNFDPCPGEGKQLDEKAHYEMPDREQYLESLEAKLRKIKGNKKTEKEEARRMVREMQLHKEDRWGSAMQEVIPIDFSGDFREDPCAAPFIVRFLFPERSALTADELQKLLDNDCLTALVDQEGDPVTLNQDADSSSPQHSP